MISSYDHCKLHYRLQIMKFHRDDLFCSFNFEVLLCGGCERRQSSNHNFCLYPFSPIIVGLELGMPFISYTSNLFGCWLYLSKMFHIFLLSCLPVLEEGTNITAIPRIFEIVIVNITYESYELKILHVHVHVRFVRSNKLKLRHSKLAIQMASFLRRTEVT